MKVFGLILLLLGGAAAQTTSTPAEAGPSAEELELSHAVSEAGSSPVEFIRVLEAHLARYPKSARAPEVERALVKAAMEVKDDRRIALYGERVLERESDDLQLLDRVARALLADEKPRGAERALAYARKSEQLVASMRSQKPSGRISQGRWEDEVDQALARALAIQSRASGTLGRSRQAVALALRSYEVFPSAEAAREAGRWLAASGDPAQAVEWYATAFAIPDSRATDSDRARDRGRMGDLYRQWKKGDTGLGDLVLAAYDRAAARLAQRRLRLAAAEPNANLTDMMDFTLSGLNGEKLEMGKLRGKTLVLDFWATWCGPCRTQYPLYEEVKRRFRDRPEVVFLSVNTDEERELVAPFLQRVKWSRKVYFEDGLSKALEINSIPTTIVVNRRGEVFSRLNGFLPERFVDMLAERIEAALND